MVIRSLARFAVGITVVGAALAPSFAGADTSSSSGWTTYSAAPPGSTVQTLQGTSDGSGGCTFDYASSLTPSQTATRADEVAFNPSTCQSQVAFTYDSGAAPETAIRSDGDQTASGDVASPATTAARAPAPGPAPGAIHSAGYMKSWYEDPIGLVVNSVKNGTDWNWNRTCVVAPVSGSYVYTWFSPSGWVLQQNNWQNFYTCAQSTSSSYVHFHNGVFCAFIATDTYYNRNTVHGQANGTLAGSISATKAGGCINLLSFHWSLKRTLN